MLYYNLNNPQEKVDFSAATIKGQGAGKGLFFPEKIPALSKDFIKNIGQYSKEEIGLEVMKPYVGACIPENILAKIVEETVNFPFPLVPINEKIYSLELFHGPTLAFKDVGARFMSRCLGYFNRGKGKKTTVLVATSGDTGGAVANGFEGVENVDVIILYPSGKVSPVQELQLTTCAENIQALEINGTFDDCQAIVKQAFTDEELAQRYSLTSANSINVARWLPQQLYYFFAYKEWIQHHEEAPVVCVPSGNFGNICAGILAHISGLPAKHFLAACNANDTVARFLQTENYAPQKVVHTISNAMDVSDPSNFVRIMELFQQQVPSLKKVLSSNSVTDELTKVTVAQVYKNEGYLLDPHGAVAYHVLEQYLQLHTSDKGYLLETAHPVKFPEIIEDVLQISVPIPEMVKPLFKKEKHSTKIEANYEAVKAWLLS